MPRNFGPMLAASFEDDEMGDNLLDTLNRRVTFPVLASPKIDGIRFMVKDATAMSRSWKPLPNQHFQGIFKTATQHFENLDGEVVIGQDPAGEGLFNRTQSAIMSQGGQPDFSLHIFDRFENPIDHFESRHTNALDSVDYLRDLGIKCVYKVDHSILRSPEEVLAYEQEALESGYEGIMLRSPKGLYKFGRSTVREQGLIKIKRFVDAEAKIIGFKALERNQNAPEKNAFGLQVRSSHKAGKVETELLGTLVVTKAPWGEFEIGSGFDMATREDIWKNQSKYLHRLVTFKYQPHGVKDKPRAPIFKGIRWEMA
jgi:DNA ligase-1